MPPSSPDHPDDRVITSIGDLTLESGVVLPDVRIAHESWGTRSGSGPDSNAVLVLHALTGDSHVTGPAGPHHPTSGWWDAAVGPGRALDTDRFFVIAPNILGGCQGTTGPGSTGPNGRPWGRDFPALTVRDQMSAEARWADALGLDTWHAVIGGSAGGMRALEWAIKHPDRVQRLLLLATSAAASAEQIGLSTTQIAAIRSDPVNGLDLARRIAHLAYRCEPELQERFGRERQADGRWAVESYLAHHGTKLTARFDPNSYVVLSEAMDSHDVGRDRGGIQAALSRVTARTTVSAIDSDRLYPPHQQRELARGIRAAGELRVVTSTHGHDGFLVEIEQVSALLRELLDS